MKSYVSLNIHNIGFVDFVTVTACMWFYVILLPLKAFLFGNSWNYGWTCCNEHALYLKSSLRIIFSDFSPFWVHLQFHFSFFCEEFHPDYQLSCKQKIYVMDYLAFFFYSCRDILDSFFFVFENFTLFHHLLEDLSSIFWAAIGSHSFWCHAEFVSKYENGDIYIVNDKYNMFGFHCTKSY